MTNMITNQFLEIWNVKNCPFQYWGSETLHWLDSSNSSSVRRNINDVNRVEAGTAPVSRQKYWKLLIILNTLTTHVIAGCGGWIRILRQAPAGHSLLRPQLLRRVRQCRGDDVSGWDSHVLIPGEIHVALYSLWTFVFSSFIYLFVTFIILQDNTNQ